VPLEDAGESGDEHGRECPLGDCVGGAPPGDVVEGDEVVAFAETGAGNQEIGCVATGAEIDIGTDAPGSEDVAVLLGSIEPTTSRR
jgi:hypothetical protein